MLHNNQLDRNVSQWITDIPHIVCVLLYVCDMTMAVNSNKQSRLNRMYDEELFCCL